jgi:tetratricopeptide (TPR) repeat protein
MLTIKNPGAFLLVLAAGLWLLASGCTPPGPRELLAGKKLLDRGKFPEAIEKFREAASIMSTNAQAWNYLGLACHQAGQNAEAERAYQRALALNHDLTEAHYNLGCLLLAQNRLEAAKTELTAYTLRQDSSVDGFLKLGTVQLRLREGAAAEKSFTDALRLKPEDPEALTGIGLARVARGKARDSISFFTRAIKQQPVYAPALLNLAVVAHLHLQDRELALKSYREYAALKPAPESLQSVQVAIRQLEQDMAPPPKPVSVPSPVQSAVIAPAKPMVTNAPRALAISKSDAASSVLRSQPAPPKLVAVPRPEPNPVPAKPAPTNAPVVMPPAQTVQLAEEPLLKAAQDVSPGSVAGLKTTTAPPVTASSSTLASSQSPKPQKRSFLQKVNPLSLFASDSKSAASSRSSASQTVSGATAGAKPDSGAAPSSAEPVHISSPRYSYKSPPKPSPGNRVDAERVFAQAYQAYEARKLSEAIQGYRRAGELDPSYFDAAYNLGVAAAENANQQLALSSYENALAVRPESLDARYNFALVLKQANYLIDAANELEKVLSLYPKESRAHLALGNLYAQQLRQPAKAREHYLKVLENDPRNPQAGAIRYWLAENPK